MQAIHPAVQRTEKETGQTGKEIVEPCAIHNVFYQIERLVGESAILREALHSGELMIVGAIYDVESGKVVIHGGIKSPVVEELTTEPGHGESTVVPKHVEPTTEPGRVELTKEPVHEEFTVVPRLVELTSEPSRVERRQPVRRPSLLRFLFTIPPQP